MTKYGFVIDHRRCIGCHACTVACKSENDVPLGAFRTWVKYVEKGTFPNTRRYFTIMRCQHCEDAPCVKICPTSALYKRKDGIVDFDSSRCIGCKACMQACPYDALYIDPETHTAAKCHYCAHRTDRGLLPACVIVCPEKAIIAGDLEDPTSEIARMVAREQVQIRRPEQGTRPQVFYVGADETSMTPGMATQPSTYLWAQRGPEGVDLVPKGDTIDLRSLANGGHSVQGPATTVYDIGQPKPWGWRVGTYLWTKAIAAGVAGVAGVLLGAGLVPATGLFTIAAPLLALIFIAVTGGLLIWDLKRPERFLFILTKGNTTSWLYWGTWLIVLFGIVGGLWLVAGLTGQVGLVRVLAWIEVPLAIGTAGYSAFLFGQAEGRDFWQSPILLWHLLVGSVAAGAATLLVVGFIVGMSAPDSMVLAAVLLGGVAGAVLLSFADLYSPHPNKDVAKAAHMITRGTWSGQFWGLVVVLGGIVPIVLAAIALAGVSAIGLIAGLLALVGLWVYENIWVRAGQSVAIS